MLAVGKPLPLTGWRGRPGPEPCAAKQAEGFCYSSNPKDVQRRPLAVSYQEAALSRLRPVLRKASASRYAICCALLIALAAALRFYDLGGSTLRYDEGALLEFVAGTWEETLESVKSYHSAPIGYPALLWVIQQLDVSVVSARIAPAVASVLMVAAMALWLPAVGLARPAAFLAALIAALSPMLIEHARDAREYGVDALVATLMIVGLLAWLRARQRWLLALTLFIAPLVQYGLVFFGIATLAAGALRAARDLPAGSNSGGNLSRWLRAAQHLWLPALAFAAACGWSYSLTAEAQLSHGDTGLPFFGYWPYDADYRRLVGADGAGVASMLAVIAGKTWSFFATYTSALIAALALPAIAFAAFRQPGPAYAAVFVLGGASLVVAVIAAAANVWPLGGFRTSMWLAPVTCVAFGCAIHAAATALPQRHAMPALILAAAVIAGALAQQLRDANPWQAAGRENLEVIATALEAGATQADVIFVHYSMAPQMRFYQRAGRHDFPLAWDCEAHWGAQRCFDAWHRLAQRQDVQRFWFIGTAKREIGDAMGWLRREGLAQAVAPSLELLSDPKPLVRLLQDGGRPWRRRDQGSSQEAAERPDG